MWLSIYLTGWLACGTSWTKSTLRAGCHAVPATKEHRTVYDRQSCLQEAKTRISQPSHSGRPDAQRGPSDGLGAFVQYVRTYAHNSSLILNYNHRHYYYFDQESKMGNIGFSRNQERKITCLLNIESKAQQASLVGNQFKSFEWISTFVKSNIRHQV